jgi:adenylyltransferase/sulfurtransferase
MTTFAFSLEPLDPGALAAPLAAAAAGGFVAFEGRVRDHNEGQSVTALDYEAFEELALAEGNRIVEAAMRRHGVLKALCVHRLGRLAVGDVAVWVGVAGVHRDEAFAACREIIDEIKHRVPIWKKEHYATGDSGWVNCERCAAHAHEPAAAGLQFDYSRQAALPEIGAAGQERLARASVVVIGAGGLGCAVLAGLAGAGVGTIAIVDHDVVEATNLHRQPLYAMADIGRPKAEAAAERLAAYNPSIRLQPRVLRLDAATAAEAIDGFDVVVDCSAISPQVPHQRAMRANVPAVLASVYQYEGQLQVVRPDAGGSCLRCQWPDATRDGITGNCRQSGVLGPVPPFGSSQRRLSAPRDLRCAGTAPHRRTA